MNRYMKNLHKYYALLLSFCFYSVVDAQQRKDSIPLHYYLQNNFDTTFVLHKGSAWDNSPNYRILSMKDQKISAFTYTFPFPFYRGLGSGILPKDLIDKWATRFSSFRRTLPDTNEYFLPRLIAYTNKQGIRNTLDSIQLGAIQDDSKDNTPGCGTNMCAIFDSDEYTIWFITKKEITKLYFYAPVFFENCCPGSKGRQTAIRLINLMQTVFP